MGLKLTPASMEDAELVWKMQTEAFAHLFSKYQDFDTNPGNEPLENIIWRIQQPFSYYYRIDLDNETVGAIRIVDKKETAERKRISPLFVLPRYCGRGIAQWAICEAERIHGSEHWELDTILQEAGNCHLYEKMGYRATGKTKPVNDKMTLVFYEK